jgi:hypothetical protein
MSLELAVRQAREKFEKRKEEIKKEHESLEEQIRALEKKREANSYFFPSTVGAVKIRPQLNRKHFKFGKGC